MAFCCFFVRLIQAKKCRLLMISNYFFLVNSICCIAWLVVGFDFVQLGWKFRSCFLVCCFWSQCPKKILLFFFFFWVPFFFRWSFFLCLMVEYLSHTFSWFFVWIISTTVGHCKFFFRLIICHPNAVSVLCLWSCFLGIRIYKFLVEKNNQCLACCAMYCVQGL